MPGRGRNRLPSCPEYRLGAAHLKGGRWLKPHITRTQIIQEVSAYHQLHDGETIICHWP